MGLNGIVQDYAHEAAESGAVHPLLTISLDPKYFIPTLMSMNN